jgi:cytochrome P450
LPRNIQNGHELPVASLKDRAIFLGMVAAPPLLKGPLARRPLPVMLSERLGLDAGAVKWMSKLKARYGDGPLLVPVPGRIHAVIFQPDHVQKVLGETPAPFDPATDEKRAALGHFEPNVSLASRGGDRDLRRRFNDQVLENDRPVHSMAAPLLAVVADECDRLPATTGGRLDWDGFNFSWHALIRRVVLGAGAREDHALTDLLAHLRFRGNWVVLKRRKEALLAQMRAMINGHIARGDPHSLAGRIARLPQSDEAEAPDQIAHYLFAFDAAGMATFRALALLAAHPDAAQRVREETAESAPRNGGEMLPFSRAVLMESLRLWPTTPVILRQAREDVAFDAGVLPKGANVIIFAPFFHRADSLPFAHRFAPDLWLRDDSDRPVSTARDGQYALVPFSYGPGRCPASDLVPLLASAFISRLMSARTVGLEDPRRMSRDAPMPGLLDHFTLSLTLQPGRR